MDRRDKIIEELRAFTAEQAAVIERLTARVAELELQLAKANKDSSTSSKPPSSDIAKSKSKAKKTARKKPRQGGQPKHQRQLRQPLPVDRVDEVIDYEIEDTEAEGSSEVETYDLSQDSFRFMFAGGVEPTNNHSEQQIRHCVIDRKITQGTRSEVGQRYHERMWTMIATCKKQNRNIFKFLQTSITAHLTNQTPQPSSTSNNRERLRNIQLYPDRRLKKSDKNGYVLKFYCPILKKRIRRNCGTRDRREARRILSECRERLLNGDYERSAGAITADVEKASTTPLLPTIGTGNEGSKSWQECFERYRRYHKNRVRKSTHLDAIYGIQIAE